MCWAVHHHGKTSHRLWCELHREGGLCGRVGSFIGVTVGFLAETIRTDMRYLCNTNSYVTFQEIGEKGFANPIREPGSLPTSPTEHFKITPVSFFLDTNAQFWSHKKFKCLRKPSVTSNASNSDYSSVCFTKPTQDNTYRYSGNVILLYCAQRQFASLATALSSLEIGVQLL